MTAIQSDTTSNRAVAREVRLELLLKRRVRDRHDRVVGHLIEVIGEQRPAGVCEVTEYRVSRMTLLERLLGPTAGVALMQMTGRQHYYRVPWQEMDLSDPSVPRLRSAVAELEVSTLED